MTTAAPQKLKNPQQFSSKDTAPLRYRAELAATLLSVEVVPVGR